ncbi:ferric/cupric reductase transmembrane component 2 [Trichomonascus vanleenenianus]|uniref:ferric reductase family protein n=1 Tax=Trichomonascus vanleenenianus TaxID=2268995 RepID=UPI003EC99CC6
MKLTNTLLTTALIAGGAIGNLNNGGGTQSISTVENSNAVDKSPYYIPNHARAIERRDESEVIAKSGKPSDVTSEGKFSLGENKNKGDTPSGQTSGGAGGKAGGAAAKGNNKNASRVFAANLGFICWGFMLLVIVLRGIVYWTMRLAPGMLKKVDNRFVRRLRKHVFLAPSVSYHHSAQPAPRLLGRFTFNIPTRDQTLILIGLFICSFVPLFVGYTVDPTMTPAQKKIQVVKTGAVKAGIAATVLSPLFFLFAGRNNFLLWLTGWPLDTFNVFHKWIGRWVIVLLSVHGLMYTINSELQNKLYTNYHKPYYRWGTVGYLATLFIFFQAMHFFRTRNYELFLYVHITLAIVFVLSAWYHLIDLGCNEYVYASIAVWAFDRLMRIVRLLWSGVRSKAQCVLHHEGNIIEIKIDYSQRWKFYPGAYVFVHFARWNRFWQSHPFTLVESPRPTDDGKLVVFLRTKRGVTKTIRRYLEENGGTAETGVLVEGPYGPRYPVHRYDTIVCFAGGIGVTAPYSHAVEILKHPELKTRVVFVWVVSDEKPLIWFKEYLDAMRKDPRFEVIIHVTCPSSTTSLTEYAMTTSESEDIEHVSEKSAKRLSDSAFDFKPGRPQTERIISDVTSDSRNGNVAVVVCGPGEMNDDVRSTVRKNIVDASTRIDLFEESFSW